MFHLGQVRGFFQKFDMTPTCCHNSMHESIPDNDNQTQLYCRRDEFSCMNKGVLPPNYNDAIKNDGKLQISLPRLVSALWQNVKTLLQLKS